MIKLDPDEEADDDDEEKPKSQKQILMPPTPNQVGNSSFLPIIDGAVNNVHMNNVQINLTRINLPPEYQNFVSFNLTAVKIIY